MSALKEVQYGPLRTALTVNICCFLNNQIDWVFIIYLIFQQSTKPQNLENPRDFLFSPFLFH
jgi:hypothetical protein